MRMNDLLKMILSALGAVAGATAILASLALVGATVVTVSSGVVSAAITVAPAVICIGGVAYAASKTGFGMRG